MKIILLKSIKKFYHKPFLLNSYNHTVVVFIPFFRCTNKPRILAGIGNARPFRLIHIIIAYISDRYRRHRDGCERCQSRPLFYTHETIVIAVVSGCRSAFFPSRKNRNRRIRKRVAGTLQLSVAKGWRKKNVPLRKIINGVVFSRWLTSSTSITQMVQQTIIMRPGTTIGRRRITSRPRYCSYIMF